MKAWIVLLAATGALVAGIALAQSGQELLKSKGCLNCHEADKKKVGPSWKDIAAKAKGVKGAQAAMIEKLKSGKGHPKAAASEAELKTMVDEVVSAK